MKSFSSTTTLKNLLGKRYLKASAALLLSLSALPAQADIKKVKLDDITIPVIIPREFNPVMSFTVNSDEAEESFDIALQLSGIDTKFIKEVSIFRGDSDDTLNSSTATTEKVGYARSNKIGRKQCIIECDKANLVKGDNKFLVSVTLSEKAPIGASIELQILALKSDSTRNFKVKDGVSKQRIGTAITYPSFVSKIQKPDSRAKYEERTSKFARIPGLTVTKKGTLIATFDNRYRHNGDLPADIDVAVRRSTDGGQTWSDIYTCMNARDLEGIGHGVGDPAILVDDTNNRVWIAGLAAPKTGHPIWKSQTGSASPDVCGQFILCYSDDDGITWSEPINITEEIKRLGDKDTANWGCLFQGPGNGITMRDGTLVFPAQVWGEKKAGDKIGSLRHGVLVYSKDKGKTWTSSKAMEFGGSESTVAELTNGDLMLNTREGAGGYRQVGTTKNLGETWKKHNSVSTEKGRLRQPFCQAIMVSLFNDKGQYNFGTSAKHMMFYSNPESNQSQGRRFMKLKFSKNNGKAWSKGLLYDQRKGMGYSAIYPIDEDYMGVLYESQASYINFLKIPYKEIVEAK